MSLWVAGIADVRPLIQDSYTDGGRQDGGPLPAPVITPPDAEAGGRSTDGKVWVEDIADDIGATIMDYAVRYPCTVALIPRS